MDLRLRPQVRIGRRRSRNPKTDYKAERQDARKNRNEQFVVTDACMPKCESLTAVAIRNFEKGVHCGPHSCRNHSQAFAASLLLLLGSLDLRSNVGRARRRFQGSSEFRQTACVVALDER